MCITAHREAFGIQTPPQKKTKENTYSSVIYATISNKVATKCRTTEKTA